MRLMRVVACLIVLLGGTLMVSTPAAQAAVSCLSSEHNYFDGYIMQHPDSSANTYEGVGATIAINNGVICDTGDQTAENFWFVWVMIHAGQMGPSQGYAQAGYFRYWGSCRYWTTEYRRDNSDTFHRHIDTADGCKTFGTNHYQVRWNSTTGDEEMLVDGVVKASTPFDIFTVWPWSTLDPYTLQYSAETKYIGDDVPGTSSSPDSLTSAQGENYANNWTNSLGQVDAPCADSPVRYARSSWSDGFSFYSTTSTSTTLRC